MDEPDLDASVRLAAFEHVRRLSEVHDHLTAIELRPGFIFGGERIALMNPHRGVFKPQQMRFLLSIKTVFPKPGGKIWYDDQREVHRQIFEGDETIDYAFMGQDPNAADNRWLREAWVSKVRVAQLAYSARERPLVFRGYAPERVPAHRVSEAWATTVVSSNKRAVASHTRSEYRQANHWQTQQGGNLLGPGGDAVCVRRRWHSRHVAADND